MVGQVFDLVVTVPPPCIVNFDGVCFLMWQYPPFNFKKPMIRLDNAYLKELTFPFPFSATHRFYWEATTTLVNILLF